MTTVEKTRHAPWNIHTPVVRHNYVDWSRHGLKPQPSHVHGPLMEPDGVKREQVVRIVVKYLEDNPKDLHRDEGLLVAAALVAAYPCKPADKP